MTFFNQVPFSRRLFSLFTFVSKFNSWAPPPVLRKLSVMKAVLQSAVAICFLPSIFVETYVQHCAAYWAANCLAPVVSKLDNASPLGNYSMVDNALVSFTVYPLVSVLSYGYIALSNNEVSSYPDFCILRFLIFPPRPVCFACVKYVTINNFPRKMGST